MEGPRSSSVQITLILRRRRNSAVLQLSAGHSTLPSRLPWWFLPAPLQRQGHGCPTSVSHSMFPSQGVMLYSLNELSPFCL